MALDMSMTYIIVAFATVLLNNVFLSLAPFRMRIFFGYAISFTTLTFVALCEVAWHMFSKGTAYSASLAAVSLVAIGCTGRSVGVVSFSWFLYFYLTNENIFLFQYNSLAFTDSPVCCRNNTPRL